MAGDEVREFSRALRRQISRANRHGARHGGGRRARGAPVRDAMSGRDRCGLEKRRGKAWSGGKAGRGALNWTMRCTRVVLGPGQAEERRPQSLCLPISLVFRLHPFTPSFCHRSLFPPGTPFQSPSLRLSTSTPSRPTSPPIPPRFSSYLPCGPPFAGASECNSRHGGPGACMQCHVDRRTQMAPQMAGGQDQSWAGAGSRGGQSG